MARHLSILLNCKIYTTIHVTWDLRAATSSTHPTHPRVLVPWILVYSASIHSFCLTLVCVLSLSCFILVSFLNLLHNLWLVNIKKWYPNVKKLKSSWLKQGHTSVLLSVLISIFPSKGPHVVPTGSCCRLWIRRSPSLRNASSSPKNTPEPNAVSHSALFSTQVSHQITVMFIHCPFPSNLHVPSYHCLKAPQLTVKVKAKQFQNG